MPEEIEEQKHKKKKKRRKKHYFLRLLIFIACIIGVIFALRSDLFSVKKFDVSGNVYYTAAQIQEISGLTTGVNMFEQRLRPAKETLIADPYIKDVDIKRVPMHTIKIDVNERSEYACLPYESEFLIIDDEGMVLRKTDEQPALPLLAIAENEILGSEPGKALDVEKKYLLTSTLELLDVMNDNDIYFKKIEFSTVIVRAYIYDDLYCEGKPEHITSQMPAIKRLVEEQYSQGITRGIIMVGKDNYIAFNPVVK